MKSLLKTKHSLCIVLLTVFILLFGTQMIYAQTPSPAIMSQINAELQKRGLNEAEVRTRLLQEGIDLENIPVEQLPQYQTRVTAILDEMEAEKKAAGSPEVISEEPVIAMPEIIESGTGISETSEPPTTKEEAIAEAAQRVIQAAAVEEEGPVAIYGHSLFTDQTLDVFRTTDGAFAPDSYILGAGDEIRITIFGASQTDMQLMINNEGYIQPTGMPKIFLQGLSLQQARNLLYKRLSVSYTFRSDQFALTIATARTIMVNIFGETKITGGFTLSALNSAFNALSAAGGPTDIGSVRNIQLIRGQSRKKLDLYAFMIDPAIQYQFDLQQNDIIYVPVVQNLVTLEGAVKRPMRYEMLPKETLTDLINYAGGLNIDAYPDFVQIQRYVNGEIRLQEYNLAEVLSGKINVPLQNGDIVRIKSIEKPIEQYVEITGSVYYPGRYDLNANPTLDSLLYNAQFTTQARTDLLFVERIRPDETVEVLTIPWTELQNSGQEFMLKARDRVQVLELASYRDVATITVSGHVRAPFEKTFALGDRLTVEQALELAGGVRTSAYPVAYIFRKNLSNPEVTEYIRINLQTSSSTLLQPGDKLNVYDNTLFTNVGEVQILGAVNRPREFPFDPSITIRDLLTAAGGFDVGAALNRIEVFRTEISSTEEIKLKMITIEVDSNYQLVHPANFNLQPYDKVIVRLTPSFSLGREVEITGEIKYPGMYVLGSRQTHLSELVQQAGGLLDGADANGSRLFRTFNNTGYITMNVAEALLYKGEQKFDPILFEGDIIYVARYENTISIRKEGTMIPGVIKGDNINIVLQGNKTAGWYIKNYAGGFKKRADKKSLIVILRNGQVMRTKRFLGINRFPKVEAGSLISLEMKPPKVKKESAKEKTDWGKLLGTTLTGLTAALTVIVLANQLK